MKKYIFISVLLCGTLLCSCDDKNAAYTGETVSQTLGTDTSAVSASTAAAESNGESCAKTYETASETVPDSAFPEDEAIRAYVNAFGKTLYSGGGLYDLDFDGVPEYVWRNGGEGTTEFYYVYKYLNGVPEEIGVMIQNYYNDLFTVPEITLYYDREADNYFYVSESAATDKMSLSKHSESTRYTFSGDKMTAEILSRCDFDTHWDNELLDFETIDITSNILLGENTTPVGITQIEDMTSYYDGLADYLATFEKAGVFEFRDMTDGDYENTYDNLYYNYYINNENKLTGSK